jgi:hypothetical protein
VHPYAVNDQTAAQQQKDEVDCACMEASATS